MSLLAEMGVCFSCLGLAREDNDEPSSESAHLLADPQNMQYGGTGGNDSRTVSAIDPDDLRKQRDVLERLCQQASERLIDIAPPSVLHAAPSHNNNNAGTTSSSTSTIKLTNPDGHLFESVFFGQLDKEEVERGFAKLGTVDVKTAAPNKPTEGSVVYRF